MKNKQATGADVNPGPGASPSSKGMGMCRDWKAPSMGEGTIKGRDTKNRNKRK